MSSTTLPAHLGTSAEEYGRLGLKQGQIEGWEDGLRTSGGRGTYEWWYFDAHLDDGAKLVIVFYTKEIAGVDGPLAPTVAFTLDRADGSRVEKHYNAPARAFSAAKERCDVCIGPNVFKGDLQRYEIHVEIEDVLVDLTLTGTVPPWRPDTGYLLFGARDEHYFAWLPAVPEGDAAGTITLAGQARPFTGAGYHDHNWGNISLLKLVNNWYWARGKAGDYTIIASFITTEKKYGYQTVPVFMLAERGRILVDDASKVTFAKDDISVDGETRRPVANHLVYDYRDGNLRYVLTFERKNTILRMKLVETIKGIQALLARLIGFDGAFLRFTGGLAIERYDGDRLVESHHEEAIWELMYCGRVRAA